MFRKNSYFKFSTFAIFCLLFFASCNPKSINGNDHLSTNTNIKIVDKKGHDISIAASFIANSKDNEIIIGNAGSAAALNVRARFSESIQNAGIIENSKDCEILSIGKTCALKISTSSQIIPETDFIIQGDNTNPIKAALSVSEARMCILQNSLCADNGVLALSINDNTTINIENKSDVDIIGLDVNVDQYAKDSVIPQVPVGGYCDEGILKAGEKCDIELKTLSSPRPVLFSIIVKGQNSNPIKIHTSVSEAKLTGDFSNIDIDLNIDESVTRSFSNNAAIDIKNFKITSDPKDQKCLEITSVSPTLDCADSLTPSGMNFIKDGSVCEFKFKALGLCEKNLHINFNAQNISSQPIIVNTTSLSGSIGGDFADKTLFVGESKTFEISNTSSVGTRLFNFHAEVDDADCLQLSSSNCNEALHQEGKIFGKGEVCHFSITDANPKSCSTTINFSSSNATSQKINVNLSKTSFEVNNTHPDPVMLGEFFTLNIATPSGITEENFHVRVSNEWEKCFVTESSSSTCTDTTLTSSGCDFSLTPKSSLCDAGTPQIIITGDKLLEKNVSNINIKKPTLTRVPPSSDAPKGIVEVQLSNFINKSGSNYFNKEGADYGWGTLAFDAVGGFGNCQDTAEHFKYKIFDPVELLQEDNSTLKYAIRFCSFPKDKCWGNIQLQPTCAECENVSGNTPAHLNPLDLEDKTQCENWIMQ